MSKIDSLKARLADAETVLKSKQEEIQAARSQLVQKRAEIERLKIRLGQLPANAKAEEYATRKQLQTLQSEADSLEYEDILRMEAERDTLQADLKTARAAYDAVRVSGILKDLKPLIEAYNEKSRELAGLIDAIYRKYYSIPPEIRNCAPGTHRENIHKLPTLNLPSRISTCPVTAEQQPETLFSLRQFAKGLTGIDDAANWGPELHFYEPPKQNW